MIVRSAAGVEHYAVPPMATESSDSRRVKEIKTVPYAPLSHPFVQRLIGTIRRECLDRTLFWTAADLETKLVDFQRYYNGYRAHAGLDGSSPESIPDSGGARASLRAHSWQAHCRGLYQTPMAA